MKTNTFINHLCILLAIFFVNENLFAQKLKCKINEQEIVTSTCITVSSEVFDILQTTRTAQYVKNNFVDLENYNSLVKKTLNYLENNGYPFASIYLDNIIEKSGTVFANLVINKNIRCTFDSIVVRGNIKISKSYLKAYLNFTKRKPYNESIIKLIPQLVQEIPFVTETQPSVLEFTEDKTSLYLFLDKKRINQFDGYLGLVPICEQTRKIAIYGAMNLHLMNLLTVGESIDLLWRASERFSQFLEIKANFPYLIGTPLGIDGLFMLDKKDTTYLNMNYIIGISYSFRGNNYARIYFDYSTSNLLNMNLFGNSDYFSYRDYKKTMYGFAFRFRQLDFIYNPHKGYELNLSSAMGVRKILDTRNFNEDKNDGLEMNSMRYKFEGKIRGYLPLHKRWVMVLGAEGGCMLGNQTLYNEFYRLGGLNSLQGFDDFSIRASSYGIGIIELRFFMGRIAYLNTFFNGAWYEQNSIDNYKRDFPFGFGLGVTFTTKAGIFYLSYALGKQSDNLISFKTGKIHFGLAVQF